MLGPVTIAHTRREACAAIPRASFWRAKQLGNRAFLAHHSAWRIALTLGNHQHPEQTRLATSEKLLELDIRCSEQLVLPATVAHFGSPFFPACRAGGSVAAADRIIRTLKGYNLMGIMEHAHYLLYTLQAARRAGFAPQRSPFDRDSRRRGAPRNTHGLWDNADVQSLTRNVCVSQQ